jgi:cardiolipin synthase
VTGSRGPLSAQRSKEIIDGLRQKVGNIDILQKHIALEEAFAGTPLTAGNRAVLLQNGPATYKAMFAAMRGARDHINLESYIIEDDDIGREFADLLLEMQGKGVQVNLIYDSVGSLNTPRAFFDRLRQAGIKVLEFNPVNPLNARRDWRVNNRDHRKLLVVDGRVAFLGGINISSVYSSSSSGPSGGLGSSGKGADKTPWRDTQVQIEGPAVAGFQKMFLDTWSEQHGEPLDAKRYLPKLAPRGGELVRAISTTSDDENSTIYLTLLSAIENAEKQIYITNAYFVPDPQLMAALIAAVKRGVDVRLLLPGHTDFWAVFHAGRSHYEDLLEGGVRIFERGEALLHSKTAVIDGVWSCIGSANMDWRSFLHNSEINAVIMGPDFAGQMLAMFEDDLKKSSEVTAEAWSHRPLHMRAREWAARLWEYWL